MAKNGSAILLAVNTGTDQTPVFSAIPCQTSAEYTLSVDAIDTSCKDSPDNTNIPGARDRTISVESNPTDWPEFAVSPSGSEEVLRAAAEAGEQIRGCIVVDGDNLEEFVATITGFSVSAPREDKVTMSIDLQLSGGLTPFPAAPPEQQG